MAIHVLNAKMINPKDPFWISCCERDPNFQARFDAAWTRVWGVPVGSIAEKPYLLQAIKFEKMTTLSGSAEDLAMVMQCSGPHPKKEVGDENLARLIKYIDGLKRAEGDELLLFYFILEVDQCCAFVHEKRAKDILMREPAWFNWILVDVPTLTVYYCVYPIESERIPTASHLPWSTAAMAAFEHPFSLTDVGEVGGAGPSSSQP